MRCEHEATTLLWLYGEAPEEHLDHVAQCALCQQTVAMHADVASALGPGLRALAEAPQAAREATPSARRRSVVKWGIPLVAVAAAAAWLVMVPRTVPMPSEEDATRAAVETSSELIWRTNSVEHRLDELDLELESLSQDLRVAGQDVPGWEML